MKARLNITIDEKVISTAKEYALKQDTSVSELVEEYLRKISKPIHQKSIIDHIKKRRKMKVDFNVNADLVDLYYQENAKKYGF